MIFFELRSIDFSGWKIEELKLVGPKSPGLLGFIEKLLPRVSYLSAYDRMWPGPQDYIFVFGRHPISEMELVQRSALAHGMALGLGKDFMIKELDWEPNETSMDELYVYFSHFIWQRNSHVVKFKYKHKSQRDKDKKMSHLLNATGSFIVVFIRWWTRR